MAAIELDLDALVSAAAREEVQKCLFGVFSSSSDALVKSLIHTALGDKGKLRAVFHKAIMTVIEDALAKWLEANRGAIEQEVAKALTDMLTPENVAKTIATSLSRAKLDGCYPFRSAKAAYADEEEDV